MNKEIKFRGISMNEWVYGMLCKVNEGDTEHGEPIKYKIQTDEKEYGEYVQCFITDEKSIGQYTGLHDKNGKEIYEGDIVEFEDTGEEGYEYKEGFDFNNIAQVVYENGIYTLANFGESDNSYYATDCSDEEILEEVLRNGNCKVIGNIYDNPEMLGGE